MGEIYKLDFILFLLKTDCIASPTFFAIVKPLQTATIDGPAPEIEQPEAPFTSACSFTMS